MGSLMLNILRYKVLLHSQIPILIRKLRIWVVSLGLNIIYVMLENILWTS